MKQASHKKANTVQFHLREVSRAVKLSETENTTEWWLPGSRAGETGSCLMDIELQISKMKSYGASCILYEYT